MKTFQRDGSQVLEKDSLGLKGWQETYLSFKKVYKHLKGTLKEFIITTFQKKRKTF